LLLSYLPFVFVAVAIFAVASTFLWSSGNEFREDAEHANEMFALQALQTIDHSLLTIDKAMLYELQLNEGLKAYFRSGAGDDSHWLAYDVSVTIQSVMYYNPLIESMYVYRTGADALLTNSRVYDVAEFSDREFLLSLEEEDGSARAWTHRTLGDRSYLTLVRSQALPGGGKGFLVANVCGCSLKTALKSLTSSGSSYLDFVDDAGNIVFSLVDTSLRNPLSEARSAYTGMSVRSGLVEELPVDKLNGYAYLLLGIGLFALGGCVLWAFVNARKQYRPIESILLRIREFPESAADAAGGRNDQDEFAFIESSVSKLVEKGIQFKVQQEADTAFKRNQWFKDLVSGKRSADEPVLRTELDRAGASLRFAEAQFASFEIDRYAAFVEKYSLKHQKLLKFVLSRFVEENAEQHGARVWAEWLDSHRLGALFMWEDTAPPEDADAFFDSFLEWIRRHLPFTATIGVGDMIGQPVDVRQSAMQSLDGLERKATLGLDRIVQSSDVPDGQEEGLVQLKLRLHQLASYFRVGDARWAAEWKAFMEQVRVMRCSKPQILELFGYGFYRMSKELEELPEELHSIWSLGTLPRLEGLLDALELFSEFEFEATAAMTQLFERMVDLRKQREHDNAAQQVRQFIAAHYADPALSLTMLSEEFGLHPNRLSKMFKDEFGERFIDFLAQVRVERAKELLDTTNVAIQDVANRVGYEHALSFIRMFKKISGVTPGEYRQRNAARLETTPSQGEQET
jgi:AraC-like DNA-binding protein